MEYIRDPQAIYRRSFAIAEAEADLAGVADDLRSLALRLVHAAADPGLAGQLVGSDGAATAGREALLAGAAIFTDCQMVASGITRRFLPRANEVICTLDHPRAAPLAARLETTRSAAAVELWDERLEGAIVAIGNAPTTLFRLLERLDDGAPRPALVLGFPIGFVGAAEAKAELAENSRRLAFITLPGRRGGSPLASAAVNALALASLRSPG